MKKTVMEFRNQKIEFHRIIAYSIIMGIAINIISNSIGKLFGFPLWLNLIIWIGISLIIISVAQIVELYRLNSTTKLDCLFITDISEKNKLIGIPNYKISTDMEEFFDAAFSENSAYRMIWEKSGLDKLEGPNITKTNIESKKLIKEMIEYCVLEQLSMFVEDYYNTRQITKKTISYSGKDIPDVLLDNRFLKLFSEAPENRSAFCNKTLPGVYMVDENDESEGRGTLVYMTSSNGAIFRRFELTIPHGSKVSRKDNNTIEIDTRLFRLKYRFIFDGLSTFVERDFNKYYLHVAKDEELHDWHFNVEVGVKYKLTALLRPWDWKYYDWLDEYLEALSNYCDIERFYKNIGWIEAKTILRILNTPKPLR